jgi:hypothetical protein
MGTDTVSALRHRMIGEKVLLNPTTARPGN